MASKIRQSIIAAARKTREILEVLCVKLNLVNRHVFSLATVSPHRVQRSEL